MTQVELNELVIQLRRAAEILEDSNISKAEKIQTLKTIGAICSHRGSQKIVQSPESY
jgi:hypothetical protein